MGAGETRLISKEARDLARDAILLAACVRDEILRLPWFLEYHRALGVDQFLIIDNGSTDGTRELLESQDGVTIFSAEGSYAQSRCGVDWLNEILDAHALGHWVLVLDADEQFVYPQSETVTLSRLTEYLENEGAEAMSAPMLDMYSKSPIAHTGYRQGQPFVEACPYFDGEGYRFAELDNGLCSIRRGGARHRLFWEGRDLEHASPFLGKIPLIKWRKDLALEASTHIVRNAHLSRVTGAVLHFKFLQDFRGQAAIEVSRKEHFADARQYAAYNDRLSKDKALSAYYPGSVHYEGSSQLVKLGLSHMPPNYPDF